MLRSVRLHVIATLTLAAVTAPAQAQIVIPHGDYETDLEKYTVAAVTLALLVLAAWRYWTRR